MKDEHRPVHQLEHAEPTVIHHPEEDMTVLARWLQRGMEQGPRFWFLLGGSVVILFVVTALVSGLAAGKASGNQAWVELIPAKTPDEQLQVAAAHPKAPVADWARIQAAYEEYNNGLDALRDPKQRDLLAAPRLDKALELFRQVARDAPKDSSQALGAAFGIARTLEARNKLPEAIEQYRLVASTFPNTPEAKQALALAKALEDPDNVAFYKELYTYKPAAGTGPLPSIPGLVPGFGAGPGSSLNSFLKPTTGPSGIDAPPPSTGPVPAPSPAEPPKDDKPKVETPPAAPKGDLPADPFAPPK